MIRADQFPPEVVEAAAISLAEGRLPEYSWADLDDEMREFYREDARAAIAAAINAWPGVERNFWADDGAQVIILPLPTEKSE